VVTSFGRSWNLPPGYAPRFSRAALETLAIIAYRQPATRADIEYLRGVDSGGVMKTLLDKNLLRILGKKDVPGRPLIYGTSRHFLELFGLRDLADLPTLKEFTALDPELAVADPGWFSISPGGRDVDRKRESSFKWTSGQIG